MIFSVAVSTQVLLLQNKELYSFILVCRQVRKSLATPHPHLISTLPPSQSMCQSKTDCSQFQKKEGNGCDHVSLCMMYNYFL